jgi:hypothetical protein
MNRLSRFRSVATVTLAIAAFAGCDDKPGLFQACPLSQSILNACAEEADTTLITCVVEQHPMCDEQICASWEGSDSFCSQMCDVDTDCPTGSKCREHNVLAFCVPDDIPNTIER